MAAVGIPDRDRAVGAAWLRDASKCHMSGMMTMMKAQPDKRAVSPPTAKKPKKDDDRVLGTFHNFCTMSLRMGVNVAHWLNPCTTGRLACGRLLFNGLLPRRPIRAARCLHKCARVRCTCVRSSRLCALGLLSGASTPSSTIFTPPASSGSSVRAPGTCSCAQDEGHWYQGAPLLLMKLVLGAPGVVDVQLG